MREIALRVGLLVAAVAFATAAAELALRATGADAGRLLLALPGAERPTTAFHWQRGWTNLPDARGSLTHSDGGEAFEHATNAQGFRFPRDYERRKRTPRRWAVVGDSQVYGYFAEPDAHLAARLDRARPDLEAYGFGVPGYGPTQELLLLREVLRDYALDAAVVVAFVENDLNDAAAEIAYGYLAKPYLAPGADGWRVANVPVPLPLPADGDAHDYFRPHAGAFGASALYRRAAAGAAARPGLAHALARLGLGSLERVVVNDDDRRYREGFRRIDGRPGACSVVSLCPEERWLDGLPAAAAAYALMRDACAERGVRLLVVVTPARRELRERRFPISDALVAALDAQGVETLSLVAPFRDGGEWRRFIRPDWHWTEEATGLAAELVLERLER